MSTIQSTPAYTNSGAQPASSIGASGQFGGVQPRLPIMGGVPTSSYFTSPIWHQFLMNGLTLTPANELGGNVEASIRKLLTSGFELLQDVPRRFQSLGDLQSAFALRSQNSLTSGEHSLYSLLSNLGVEQYNLGRSSFQSQIIPAYALAETGPFLELGRQLFNSTSRAIGIESDPSAILDAKNHAPPSAQQPSTLPLERQSSFQEVAPKQQQTKKARSTRRIVHFDEPKKAKPKGKRPFEESSGPFKRGLERLIRAGQAFVKTLKDPEQA